MREDYERENRVDDGESKESSSPLQSDSEIDNSSNEETPAKNLLLQEEIQKRIRESMISANR